MKALSAVSIFDAKHIFILIAIVIVFGVVQADSVEGLFGYLLITAAIIAPTLLWLSAGAPGIPVFPVSAAMHFVFYALPILRDNFVQKVFFSADILTAAFTVSSYLAAATISWRLMITRGAKLGHSEPSQVSDRGLQTMMFLGLGGAVLFLVALSSGIAGLAASGLGLIRAVLLTGGLLGSFILGYLRARGLLVGMAWYLALLNLALLVILSLSSLFLIGSIIFSFAALAGYSLTSWRLPWRAVIVCLAVFYVFHAGKAEVRQKYWAVGSNSADIPLREVPIVITQWAIQGAQNVAFRQNTSSVVDRASLLNLLMRVQRVAPDYRPFLLGLTYTYLPSMLLPRFIDDSKVSSQQSQTVLNVYFGFQTEAAAGVTAIGWGVIAEGYGNFGFLGVIGIGIVMGIISGFFTRWSAGKAVLSIPTLVSVAALLVMINLESDFSYLMVNLMQACVATMILFMLFRTITGFKKSNPRPRPMRAARKYS